ncbi:MAG: hypothetical protein ACLPSL_01420, partial [Smithella sp.]
CEYPECYLHLWPRNIVYDVRIWAFCAGKILKSDLGNRPFRPAYPAHLKVRTTNINTCPGMIYLKRRRTA